jgi:hypothetical protein
LVVLRREEDMTKNFKLMIALGAAVAAGSGATAMLLGSGGAGTWFLPTAIEQTIPHLQQGNYTKTAIADLDGDGLPELISGFEGIIDDVDAVVVTVARGLEVGSWSPHKVEWTKPLPFGVSYELRSIHSADANDDGRPDLIVKILDKGENSNDWELILFTLLNSSDGGFNCAGDVTGDGETGVNDILTVIEDWGCTEGDPLN